MEVPTMPSPRVLASRLAPFTLILGLLACDERAPSSPPSGSVARELRVLGGDGQQAAVGAALPEELVVAAVDAAGRPVPGTAIQFVVVAGGGQVAPQAVTADERGFARTRWTLGTVAVDSQVVEARLEGVASLRLRARVRPDAPVTFAVSGGGAAGPVGAALADSLSVMVKDRYGNPVGGVEVTWEVVAGGGAVSPARSATRSDGVAKAQWTLGLRVDSVQVTHVRVGNLDPVAFTASAVTAGVPLQLAKRGGDGQRGPAGSVLADSLGVVLRMQDGRPVQGALVSWSVPPEAGTVMPAVSRTDANGAASTAWRLGVAAGLVQATAAVDSGTLIFTSLIQAAAPATIVAAGGGGEGPVGGALADSLAVRVTDAHGNPVPGAEIAWTAQAGGGSVQPATSRTDAQGIARAQWVLGPRVDAPQTAQAQVAGLAPVAFDASATTRGVPLQLAKRGGDGQRGPAGALLVDSLGVVLRMPDGRPVQGALVTWSVPAEAGTVAPGTSRTDADGLAFASWRLGTRAGLAQATASVDGGTLIFTSLTEAAAPARIVAVGGGGEGPVGGAMADSLAVRVTDAHGNLVQGAQVSWAAAAGSGGVQPAVSATDAQGIARAQWTLAPRVGAPAQAATATLALLPPVAFQATATTRGVPLQLARVGGDGQTGAAGSGLPDSLTVQLRTQAGAPVQGATVAWLVLSGGGHVSPATSRTDVQGRARTSWVMGPAVGPAQASARVDDGALTFSAVARVGAPAAVQVSGGDGQSGTRGTILPDSLVVRVVDAHGHAVPGVQVQWSVLRGEGHLESATSTTGSDGKARTRWAVGFTPGENTVAATVGGIPAARFAANSLEGTLRLQADTDHPVYERMGSYEYSIIATISAYVIDTRGNLAVGPAITFEGAASPRYREPTGWDTVAQAYWNGGFDRRHVIRLPPAIVRFEDQRAEFQIDSLEFLYYYSFNLQTHDEPPYSAGETVEVSVILEEFDFGGFNSTQLSGVSVVLHDDNGWTGQATSGGSVAWPLGSRTGERTLTACVLGMPGYCGEFVIEVGP
jgi:adhesin/invasin